MKALQWQRGAEAHLGVLLPNYVVFVKYLISAFEWQHNNITVLFFCYPIYKSHFSSSDFTERRKCCQSVDSSWGAKAYYKVCSCHLVQPKCPCL